MKKIDASEDIKHIQGLKKNFVDPSFTEIVSKTCVIS